MTNSGNANLTILRSGFARGVMGPELDGSTISMQDSLISDMLSTNRESGAPDDEDSIYAIFRSLKSKSQLSFLAEALVSNITVPFCFL